MHPLEVILLELEILEQISHSVLPLQPVYFFAQKVVVGLVEVLVVLDGCANYILIAVNLPNTIPPLGFPGLINGLPNNESEISSPSCNHLEKFIVYIWLIVFDKALVSQLVVRINYAFKDEFFYGFLLAQRHVAKFHPDSHE